MSKPRCCTECAEDFRRVETENSRALVAALDRIADLTRDRDEWKQQHENLLAMYHDAIRSPKQV